MKLLLTLLYDDIVDIDAIENDNYIVIAICFFTQGIFFSFSLFRRLLNGCIRGRKGRKEGRKVGTIEMD